MDISVVVPLYNEAESLPELHSWIKRVMNANNFAYEMEEIAVSAKELAGDISVDPLIELNEVQNRLDVIYKLKRKYGSTVEDILEYRAKRAEELDSINRSEDIVEELKREYSENKSVADKLTHEINARRNSTAEVLEKSVSEVLKFLEMPKVKFKVNVSDCGKFTAKGRDDVEFLAHIPLL